MEEHLQANTMDDSMYDFDCPQYVELGEDDESEQMTNADGYFVSRESDASVMDIPADWIENLKSDHFDANSGTMDGTLTASQSQESEQAKLPLSSSNQSPAKRPEEPRYMTRSAVKAKRKSRLFQQNDENNLTASNRSSVRHSNFPAAKVDASEEIMDEYMPDLTEVPESPSEPPPLLTPMSMLLELTDTENSSAPTEGPSSTFEQEEWKNADKQSDSVALDIENNSKHAQDQQGYETPMVNLGSPLQLPRDVDDHVPEKTVNNAEESALVSESDLQDDIVDSVNMLSEAGHDESGKGVTIDAVPSECQVKLSHDTDDTVSSKKIDSPSQNEVSVIEPVHEDTLAVESPSKGHTDHENTVEDPDTVIQDSIIEDQDDTLLAESDEEDEQAINSPEIDQVNLFEQVTTPISQASETSAKRKTKSRIGRPSIGGAAQSFMMATKSAAQKIIRKQPSGADEMKGITKALGKTRLTEPKTPHFATTSRIKGSSIPSTTTQQLEKVAAEKQKVLEERTKRMDMYSRAKFAPKVAKALPKKKLTEASTPAFKSSKRPGAQRAEYLKKSGHTIKPRASAAQKGPVKVTHPKPFSLETDKRIKSEKPDSSPYVSVAAQVKRFQSKTPARFRRGNKDSKVQLPAKVELKLTEPTDVKFATDARKRVGETILSSAELEAKEMSEIKPFKARPLNRRILESAGDMGVPKVGKRKASVAKPFISHTELRANRSHSRPGTPVASSSNLRSGISKRPSSSGGIMGRARSASSSTATSWGRAQTTEPKPFNFLTSARANTRPSTPQYPNADELEIQIKHRALPMPDFAKPPKLPQVEKKQPTKPLNFELPGDRRHEIAQQRLEEAKKREEEELKKARQFKARAFDPYAVEYSSPSKQMIAPRPLTNPKTPMCLQRSLELAEQHEQRRLQEAEHEEMQKAFHARPLPRTTFEKGFSPKVPHRFCESSDPGLLSDRRALERAAFDEAMNQKLRALEEEKRLEEERKKEEAERLDREYRKSLVIKARPVPNYAAMAGVAKYRSPQRLTQPESPWLETKRRAAN